MKANLIYKELIEVKLFYLAEAVFQWFSKHNIVHCKRLWV